jgi:hypothetical protein
MSIVEQLPTLVGVIVGAAATYLATAAAERSRWRRTRDARWDEARMRVYAEYGEAVKRISHNATSMAAAHGIHHEIVPTGLTEEQALLELSKASIERSARWEAVLLLGDHDTIAAARAWHECVWRLEWFARGKLARQANWDNAMHEAEHARDAFYTAARADLGVNRGPVPPPAWPPAWVGQATRQPTTDTSPGNSSNPTDTTHNPTTA